MKKPVRHGERRGIQLQHRSFSFSPATANDEQFSVGVIVTTKTPVRTWIPDPTWTGPADRWPHIEVDEVLLPEGLDYSRVPLMPLIDGHDTNSGEAKVLGRMENIRAEGDAIVGTAVFRPTREALYYEVKAGFLGQISAGYFVSEYKFVVRDDGIEVPLVHAVRWTLIETSLVPIGADFAATVRSATSLSTPLFTGFANGKQRSEKNKTKPKETKMRNFFGRRSKRDDEATLADLVTAAVDALDAVSDASDDGAEDETVEAAERLRKLRDALDDEGNSNDDEQRGRGKREDDEKDDEQRGKREGDDTDEDKEVEEARAMARSYGKLQLVNDMRKLGAKAPEIRAALLKAIANGAQAQSENGTRSKDFSPQKRSQAPLFKMY